MSASRSPASSIGAAAVACPLDEMSARRIRSPASVADTGRVALRLKCYTRAGRGTRGSKDHLVVDQQRVPLAVALSAANVNDSRLREPLVDALPPIWRPVGPRSAKELAMARYKYK